jgi:hypothetical protein
MGRGTKGIAHGIVNGSFNISDHTGHRQAVMYVLNMIQVLMMCYADDKSTLRILLQPQSAFAYAVLSDPSGASDRRRCAIFDMPTSNGEVNPR